MEKFSKQIVLAILLILIPILVKAQTCCSGGVPLSSNLGLPPGNKNVWQISISYDRNVLTTLKEGSEILEDGSRERITQSVLAEVGFGITDRISTDVFFSFVRQERTIRQFGNTNFVSTEGIGDLAMLLKYQITAPGNRNHTLVFGAGPKIPTGRSDFTREDGIILNADLQPGSGAWDGLLYGFYFRSIPARPTMGITTSVVYSFKGINSDYLNGQSYQFGNELLAQISLGDQYNVFNQLVDLSVMFRYRQQATDKFNENVLPNTGGRFLFFTPGFSYYITPGITANISGDIPVYTYVEGTQLAPSYRLNIGLYIILNSKKSLKNLEL